MRLMLKAICASIVVSCFCSFAAAEPLGKYDSLEKMGLVVMNQPPFLLHSSGVGLSSPTKVSPISLHKTSMKSISPVADLSKWLISHELFDPQDNEIDVSGRSFPIPTLKYFGFTRLKTIQLEKYIALIYGSRFGDGRFLFFYDKENGKYFGGYDFANFYFAPDGAEEDISFVQQGLRWVDIAGDVLYISNFHMTYAASSSGMNAYITAIDLKTHNILWRSKPLVSNAANFVVSGDSIISGYGFTEEKDFIYVLDRWSGEVVRSYPVKTGPERLFIKDNRLFVRTYSEHYIFQMRQ